MKHTPYWWDEAPLTKLPVQDVAASCDVAIIGAGYTGLSAALTLARAGRQVVVFEKDRPGEGASTRNGGIVSGSIRFSFDEAARKFGKPRAIAIYKEGKAAREDFWRFIAAEKIDCDGQLTGHFTGILNPRDMQTLSRTVDAMNEHIDNGAELIAEADCGQYTGSNLYYGGMYRPDVGIMHPGKFFAGLLAKALEAGVIVHSETPVTAVTGSAGSIALTTPRGSCTARNCLVASNAYTDRGAPWLRRRILPIISRMIATEPLSAELMQRLSPNGIAYGEQRRLTRYFRPSPDGQRMLLGAREAPGSTDPSLAADWVRRSLVEIYPELSETRITHSWAGNVAYTSDRLPGIFERDGLHYACGYCGSGTVWARWLGNKVAAMILGTTNATSAFQCRPPLPLPLYDGKPWFLPAVIGWNRLRDHFHINHKPGNPS